MNLLLHTYNAEIIAEVETAAIVLKSEQDAIHLLEALFESGATKVILHRKNIAPEFFDLSTRLAGEVLQKFVNYHIQVAIVGDFSNLPSVSLKAFIYESNQGRHVFFLESVETALRKLTQ